jgi:amidase
LSDPNTIEKHDTERPMKSSNRIGKRVRALCDCGSDPRASKLQQQSATRAWKDERNFKGTRVAWAGDFKGYTPYEPEAISVCKNALRAFESVGCVVEEAAPDYPLEAVWNAVLRLRSWQQGGALLANYNDSSKRAMLKPEAIFEIEMGLKLSAYDVIAASVVRSEWHQAVRRFFDQYDYLIAPTAQLFPFDVDLRWPQEIAGEKMTTYHEWMKAMLLITMSGCPALAVPAGIKVCRRAFKSSLPIITSSPAFN